MGRHESGTVLGPGIWPIRHGNRSKASERTSELRAELVEPETQAPRGGRHRIRTVPAPRQPIP